MTSLGLRRFCIHVNNRKALSGFFEILGISNSTEVMRAVDKIEKIGVQKLTEHLVTDLGLTTAQAEELIAFVKHSGNPFEVLDKYRGRSEMFDTGADELAIVARYMSSFGVPDTHFKIDLSIARGLDYYTGTVYETFLEDHPEVGSIGGGGRYDELAEYYTDKKLPGVGISIGLSRLFYILQEQQMLNPALLSAPADVLIIPMTEDLSHPISLATQMREAGLRVQLYGEDKKFKSKVAYADKLGIPYVAFLGEDEIKSGLVTVKDMQSGEQMQSAEGAIIAEIAEKIKARRTAPPIMERK
jgi:histidyl-tRNA synthetase